MFDNGSPHNELPLIQILGCFVNNIYSLLLRLHNLYIDGLVMASMVQRDGWSMVLTPMMTSPIMNI